jgi:hypothetical protein
MTNSELSISVAGVIMFVASVLAVPWLIRRLPVDHFVRPPLPHSVTERILRNILGLTLLLAGILMLVLPGQGLLTLAVAVSLLDFPLKHRLLRAILCTPSVSRAMQWVRRKTGQPPLLLPKRP